MSRTNKFILNTISTALFQVILLLSGLILPKVLLTFYGSEINGLVSSVTQFIAYLSLIEAGLSAATVYSLYKPLIEGNSKRINSILSAARSFYHKTGYLFLGLVLTGSLIYPIFIKTNALNTYEIAFLVLIIGSNGVIEFFSLAKYRALLTADQKTYIISLASIFQVIINTSVIWIFAYFGFSIVSVRLFAVSSFLFRTVLLWLYVRSKYKYLDFNEKPDVSAISQRWDALYLQILGAIQTGAPILIATFILPIEYVSIYSIYFLVIMGINSILGIFTSGIAAGFGEVIAREDKTLFKKAFSDFEVSFFIINTILFSTTMILYMPFIKIYTAGADISYDFPILALLMTINGFLHNLKTPYGMLVIAAGKYKETKIQTTVQGLIVVILGIPFTILWGLSGLVIASIFSNIYRNIELSFFIPKEITKWSFVKSFHLIFVSIFIFSFLSILGLTTIDFTNTSTFGGFIILGFLVVSIVSIIVLLINILIFRKETLEIYVRIKNLIFK